MSEKYSIYSVFDVEQHKKTYVNYLEVIIGESGKVAYAIPSHQEALIKIACRKLGVTRQELNAMCPKEYYFDFMTWLCKMTGCCSVWNEFVVGYEFTAEQVETLELLKSHGVYKGEIPKVTK